MSRKAQETKHNRMIKKLAREFKVFKESIMIKLNELKENEPREQMF